MNERRNFGVGIALATVLLSNEDGLDLSIGDYALVERPQDAPKWQLKVGAS